MPWCTAHRANAAEQPDVDVESSEIDLDLEFAIGKSDSRAKLEFVKPKSRMGLPHPNATVTSSTKGHERCVARLLDFERPSDVGAHFGFLDVCNVYDGKSAFHYAHVSDALLDILYFASLDLPTCSSLRDATTMSSIPSQIFPYLGN